MKRRGESSVARVGTRRRGTGNGSACHVSETGESTKHSNDKETTWLRKPYPDCLLPLSLAPLLLLTVVSLVFLPQRRLELLLSLRRIRLGFCKHASTSVRQRDDAEGEGEKRTCTLAHAAQLAQRLLARLNGDVLAQERALRLSLRRLQLGRVGVRAVWHLVAVRVAASRERGVRVRRREGRRLRQTRRGVVLRS